MAYISHIFYYIKNIIEQEINMTEPQFKKLEKEVEATLKNLTKNNTIKFALTWLAHDVFNESLGLFSINILKKRKELTP